MSLNRAEQITLDYLKSNIDENRHWVDKIQSLAKNTPDDFTATAQLEPQLRDYFHERSGNIPVFRDFIENNTRPASMKNLAELLLRLHTPPRPKKKSPDKPPPI